MDPLAHRISQGNRKRIVMLAGILLLSIMAVQIPSAAAADFQTGPALEWKVMDTLPTKVESGETFTVRLEFRNIGDVNLTGNKRASIELSVEGRELDRTRLEDLQVNKTQEVTFRARINDEGDYVLKLNAYTTSGIVQLWDESKKNSDIGTIEVEIVEQPINWVPIIAIVVVAAVGAGLYFYFDKKKKKAEEERRIAEEARRQDMIRKKEEEIAKKIEVRKVAGKHPRDYYVLRRTKYANLKPSGLTRSGLTILSRLKSKAELEAERISCPKCGTELKAVGDECPRCTATEKVEEIRHNIRSYKSQAAVDFKDAEVLLRKAEHRLNWSDFSMAMDIATKAENKMNEIWGAAEKGETIESTVIEFSEAEGPSLGSKVIGLEGEDAAVTAAMTSGADLATPDVAEEEPAGEPCPECGSPMLNGECHVCTFDERLNEVWAIVEKAELDGANMEEIKDLCRQATAAKERDNTDLAIRYLRRATRLAEESYHDHALKKTQGIIGFTETLISQVRALGEDVAMADQMLAKAKEAMDANQYEEARSLAAKADGYLKQIREDSFRKTIGDLMPEVEAGAAGNPDAKTLLDKAKKLIEAGELEGAVDLLEAAKDRL